MLNLQNQNNYKSTTGVYIYSRVLNARKLGLGGGMLIIVFNFEKFKYK